jgi:hypothetical protein
VEILQKNTHDYFFVSNGIFSGIGSPPKEAKANISRKISEVKMELVKLVLTRPSKLHNSRAEFHNGMAASPLSGRAGNTLDLNCGIRAFLFSFTSRYIFCEQEEKFNFFRNLQQLFLLSQSNANDSCSILSLTMQHS